MASKRYFTNPRQYHFSCGMSEAGILKLNDLVVGFERHGSMHVHEYFTQIFFVLEGKISIVTENEARKFIPGECCILPCGMQHQVNAADGVGLAHMLDLRILHHPPSALSRYVERQSMYPRGRMKIEVLLEGAARLRDHAQELSDDSVIHPGMLSVLWQFLFLSYQNPSDHPDLRSALDPRVAIVESMMRDRLHELHTVEELAAQVQLSRSQLSRLYVKAFGVSPAERYRDLRLNRACELLRATTLSVSQIAESCGFENANHFSRVFKQKRGMPPSAYR
ncbi:MAG: helix-turn-helix domain-containing protein, partial [Kiritimatiellae bacterium]|nr:helix-turn-helix domain-containing protein [Kiritimatiellia bacterium]